MFIVLSHRSHHFLIETFNLQYQHMASNHQRWQEPSLIFFEVSHKQKAAHS